MPIDELPQGVQAPAHVERGGERRADGTFAPGARTSQSKGGRARKATTALANRLGHGVPTDGPGFAPYRKMAVTFRRVHCGHLAALFGGGECGTAPSSMVASAALQLAASRFLFDHANGDPAVLKAASQLANDSRQNLAAAHEYCAKEAAARASRPADPTALAALWRAAGEPVKP